MLRYFGNPLDYIRLGMRARGFPKPPCLCLHSIGLSVDITAFASLTSRLVCANLRAQKVCALADCSKNKNKDRS